MDGENRRYAAVFVVLLMAEILWIFVMVRAFAEPSDKTVVTEGEAWKELAGQDIVWEGARLVVTGSDPYLELEVPRGIIERVTVCWREMEGIQSAGVYYDRGKGYNEYDVRTADIADAGSVSLNIRQFVKAVRVDFEDTDGYAAVLPDRILVEYAKPASGIFLISRIVVMLLFDGLFVMGLKRKQCSGAGGVMKIVAFALLQFFAFKAYIFASGTVKMSIFLMELLIMFCIISIYFGGTDVAEEG